MSYSDRHLDDPEWVEFLSPCLSWQEWPEMQLTVAAEAAKALGQLGDQRAELPLSKIILNENEDALLRLRAAAALERIANKTKEESKDGALESILSTAKNAQLNGEEEVVKLKQAIKKTWNVECQILELTKQMSNALVQQVPLDANLHETSDEYQITSSTNSIFIHAYGAFVDFGYVMFFYQNKLYYVNVEPDVKLTNSIYNRVDSLSYMAKIMIVLNKQIGGNRKTLLIRLTGDFAQSN